MICTDLSSIQSKSIRVIFLDDSRFFVAPILKFSIRRVYPIKPGAFSAKNLRETVQISLKALSPHKIHTLYLHFPDRSKESASVEDTLHEVNELSKAGYL